jgi:hypothetical protein
LQRTPGACRRVDRPQGGCPADGVPVPGPPGPGARRPAAGWESPRAQALCRWCSSRPGRPPARRARAGRPGRPARPGDPRAPVRDRDPGRGALRPAPRRRRPGGRHRPGARQGRQAADRAVRRAGPGRPPRLPRQRPRRHAPRRRPTPARPRPAGEAPRPIARRCFSTCDASR